MKIVKNITELWELKKTKILNKKKTNTEFWFLKLIYKLA